VLARGSVVYSGVTSKCLSWFASLGFKPDTGVNPLDFLIDISSVEMGDDAKRDASRAQVERLVNAWKDGGKAYSVEKSVRWSRRISKEVAPAPTKDFAAHGAALKAFFNADEGDSALCRPGLVSQTISLTSRYVIMHVSSPLTNNRIGPTRIRSAIMDKHSDMLSRLLSLVSCSEGPSTDSKELPQTFNL
jgi:hypothetical protein